MFHSRDLVNWRLVGHAIDRPGQLDLAGRKVVTEGVYAPAITYQAGRFYILNTCIGCGGNFYVTATDPAGAVVRSGVARLRRHRSLAVRRRRRARLAGQQRPAPRRAALPGPPGRSGSSSSTLPPASSSARARLLVDGGVHPEDKPIWAEGPHIYKVDGWYYLMAAEGGTAEDHSRDDLPLAHV